MEMYTMKQIDNFYDKIKQLRYGIEEADIRYCDENGLPKHLLNTQEQQLVDFILNMIMEEHQ